ncbi:hypothetical protein AtNW77_Chr3g0195861 [Arabidopsis thaliana]|uniref:Uncharacterized protein n=2 Tax=Arabidopsis TaxID=3701 RepID=A0A178VJY8_ARATH|nr:hypothetical protein ISN45_At03g035330 [Arabidopsis thaliana x Arabidopsis arenosa]OAP05363.1 hypothetical protein AXX17_AT3G36350 [Arabidopsis thaliana]
MSASSPEEDDFVVAIKFLVPQLSFCRPDESHSKWTNIKIKNPCFFSFSVVFSENGLFRIPGSGGHLIGSWDLYNAKPNPKFQRLRMIIKGIGKSKTKALVVFKLDEEANAVYTQDMGDLFIYLTKSDPLCVPTNSRIPLPPNRVLILDVDESRRVSLCRTTSVVESGSHG